MADKKVVFIAFAIEDERQRDFLKGQSLDRVPQRGVASALAVPSGQSRERVSLPLAG